MEQFQLNQCSFLLNLISQDVSWSKSPPTIEIIEAVESKIDALKPMYVPAPPKIFPEISVGVSISSKATVPTIKCFFQNNVFKYCFHNLYQTNKGFLC